MKIIVLGDIHGRSCWKEILQQNAFDQVVFMGDYFDSKEGIAPEQQAENFREILTYRRENPGKVILLIGNHDFHYFRFVSHRYSGFQPQHQLTFQNLLHQALDENALQMAFRHEHFLFTHAGVTKTWLNAQHYDAKLPLEEFLQHIFLERPEAFHFTPGINHSPVGNDVTQTPIWVRPKSLFLDAYEGFTHVVGHTQRPSVFIAPGKMILVDTLAVGEFLMLDRLEPKVLSFRQDGIKGKAKKADE